MSESFLQLLGIGKEFPGVIALDNVSLSVGRGEIVALIGENGAGKSTLMKVLGGVHQPDRGEVCLNGRSVIIRSVKESVALGIGFVHQELNNLNNLSIAANIYLGREPLRYGPLKWVDSAQMVQNAEPFLRRLGLNISPRTSLGQLSLAHQQVVEIAKALSQNAQLLILDEPTSSLTQDETSRLLRTVLEMKTQGVSVLYISHRLGEIERIADRVVALRDGRNANELSKTEITHERMVRLMIGREVKNHYTPPTTAARPGRLSVRNVQTAMHPRHSVSFEAAGGEILGFSGLVGAGRSELMQSIFGVDRMLGGQVLLDGVPVTLNKPRKAIDAGILLVPEDRRKTGLIVDMTVRENLTLPGLWECSTATLIRRGREKKRSREQVSALRIKTPSIEAFAKNLSGGNQQKIVLGKWLALRPKVLIVDEPTRGIDVGAKSEIYKLLRNLSDSGVAVIVVSSDLEEILSLSDRIAVMHEGKITGTLAREEFSEAAVMNLAFGNVHAAVSISRGSEMSRS